MEGGPPVSELKFVDALGQRVQESDHAGWVLVDASGIYPFERLVDGESVTVETYDDYVVYALAFEVSAPKES
jgi:hypothetical protein